MPITGSFGLLVVRLAQSLADLGCWWWLAHHWQLWAMSLIGNYVKSRMEILILNEKTGMDTNSTKYEDISKDAVNAIKGVCLGVKGITPQELAELLRTIADTPLPEQFRTELRDMFNQKLSTDPSMSLRSSTCVKSTSQRAT